MTNQQDVIIKMVLDAWTTHVNSADKLFSALTDEQLQQQVSPNRNRGIYLLGHLTSVHDRMLPLLDFGDQRYPELNDVFLHKPDKSTPEVPPTNDLRRYWKEVNEILDQHCRRLQPPAWFEKHTAVSEDDFKKQPHRNKLNVILNRTNHLASHLGQLLFLKNNN